MDKAKLPADLLERMRQPPEIYNGFDVTYEPCRRCRGLGSRLPSWGHSVVAQECSDCDGTGKVAKTVVPPNAL